MIRSKKDPGRVLAEVGRLGYHGGIALGRWYPELADGILVAVTEKRSRAEIDGLAEAYAKALENVRRPELGGGFRSSAPRQRSAEALSRNHSNNPSILMLVNQIPGLLGSRLRDPCGCLRRGLAPTQDRLNRPEIS